MSEAQAPRSGSNILHAARELHRLANLATGGDANAQAQVLEAAAAPALKAALVRLRLASVPFVPSAEEVRASASQDACELRFSYDIAGDALAKAEGRG